MVQSGWWAAWTTARAGWKSTTGAAGEQCVMMTGVYETQLWCVSRLDVALLSPTPLTPILAMARVSSCWTTYTAVAQRANWLHATVLDGGFITVATMRMLESSAQVGISMQPTSGAISKVRTLYIEIKCD